MPYQAVIIPLTTITAKTGLINSHFGLILCYLIINIPLASVLMGTFFLGIPRELEEAAEVDGVIQDSDILQHRCTDLVTGLCLSGNHHLYAGVE